MATVVIVSGAEGSAAVRVEGHPATIAFAAASATSCLAAGSAACNAADAALVAANAAFRSGAYAAAVSAGNATLGAVEAVLEAAEGTASSLMAAESSKPADHDKRWLTRPPPQVNPEVFAAINATVKQAAKEAREVADRASRIAADAVIVRDNADLSSRRAAERRRLPLGVASGRGCGCGIVKPRCTRTSSTALHD